MDYALRAAGCVQSMAQAADADGGFPGRMAVFAWHGIPGGIETILILFVVGLGLLGSFSRLPVSKRLGGFGSQRRRFRFRGPAAQLPGADRGAAGGSALPAPAAGDDLGGRYGGISGGQGDRAHADGAGPESQNTWEGAAANLLGSVVVALVAARWLDASAVTLLALGAAANLAGQVGDLLESSYKRSAGVKDSGQLLPGHGGMLDRIDSLTLAAPVAWWYLWMLTLSGHLR